MFHYFTEDQVSMLINSLPYVLIAIAIIQIVSSSKKRTSKENKFWETHYKRMNLIDKYPYGKQPIITPKQKKSYLRLKEFADRNNLYVFTKVHMKHLLRPEENMDKNKLEALIAPGWVDFVLCDSELDVKVIINLDAEQNPINDAVKDMIIKMFSGAGYRIMYVPEITDYYLEAII